MFNKENVLKKYGKPEDRLLISKALDKAELSSRSGRITHTDFLDPYQQKLLAVAMKGCGETEPLFDGGFAGAERAVAFFGVESSDDDFDRLKSDIFKIVSIQTASRLNLSHRDFLGALMALGIKREKTGDILVGTEVCDVVVLEEIAAFIEYNLSKVGNSEVGVQVKGLGDMLSPEFKLKEIKATVASLRLDCVSAPGFGISRSKAAEFIKAGKLSLNWESVDRPDKPVKEGDVISVRGKGKLVLEKVGSRTKKDRIVLTLRRYV